MCIRDSRYVMRTMQDKTLDDLIRQGEILRRVKRVMEGKVAYVYMSYQEAKKLHISYEDIHPISEMLRDCEDIEMGFSMYAVSYTHLDVYKRQGNSDSGAGGNDYPGDY